jgi:hypothetical protein
MKKMIEELRQMKDIELGFVRKSDGKILNFKLIDIFKSFCHVDYVNNEVRINGETLIADSFRRPYYETTLNVVKNTLDGANGTYQVNKTIYDGNNSFTVERGSQIQITILPDQNSEIESVVDELGNNYRPDNGIVTIEMNTDHTLTITISIIPRK